MINHQSSIIIQYGSLGSRGPEPWDPGAWSPGIPGPGALGSWGPEPWDPGARVLTAQGTDPCQIPGIPGFWDSDAGFNPESNSKALANGPLAKGRLANGSLAKDPLARQTVGLKRHGSRFKTVRFKTVHDQKINLLLPTCQVVL